MNNQSVDAASIIRQEVKFVGTIFDIVRVRDACNRAIRMAEQSGDIQSTYLVVADAPQDDER
jgi:hypothetical protein